MRIFGIKADNCEKRLGIKFDYNLTFDNHVNNLHKKLTIN